MKAQIKQESIKEVEIKDGFYQYKYGFTQFMVKGDKAIQVRFYDDLNNGLELTSEIIVMGEDQFCNYYAKELVPSTEAEFNKAYNAVLNQVKDLI